MIVIPPRKERLLKEIERLKKAIERLKKTIEKDISFEMQNELRKKK